MIQLSHTIDSEKGTLTLIADRDAQLEIQELIDDGGANDIGEAEALEYLIGNSELQWIQPENTGDLTNAPILGILGAPQMEEKGPYGAILCGSTEAGNEYQPILERWGYEPYQIRSFLIDLADNGKAVFQNAW